MLANVLALQLRDDRVDAGNVLAHDAANKKKEKRKKKKKKEKERIKKCKSRQTTEQMETCTKQ